MKDLLERAKGFDLQALAEIYDTYSPGLYTYAYRMLDNESLAEECVAETFSRLLHALKNGKGPRDYLQAYLYRIAHNWITDQYRRQAPLELNDELQISEEQHPEQLASIQIQHAQVRAALCRLTPEQRQVVLLKYIEGWENDQIAAALKKPVGAIKALQHRAVEALKRILLGAEEEIYESL